MRLVLYAESSLLTGNTTNYLNVHNTNKESQAKMTPPHQGHFFSPRTSLDKRWESHVVVNLEQKDSFPAIFTITYSVMYFE